MLGSSTATDQSHVQILYARDLIGAKQIVNNWIDRAGGTVDVQDIQIVQSNPTVAMIVYRKLTQS